MKKLLLLTVFLISVTLSAQTRYVSSLKATLYSSPEKGASEVASLKRGESLKIVETKDKWLKVSSSKGSGWVPALFTSTKKPTGKISILGNSGKSVRIKARKRASSNITAASARGLMQNENASSRNRSNDTQNFNPQDLTDIENVSVSENELLEFLSEGEVQ